MVERIRQGDIPGVQLRLRLPLPVPASEAWSWLTEIDLQHRWLADSIVREAETPAGLLLSSTGPGQEPYRERLTEVERQPPRRWVLDLAPADESWPVSTRLTFELTPIASTTELSILQSGFAHLPLSDGLTIWEFYRRRWRTACETLALRLQS